MNQKINSTTICNETDRAHIALTLKCNNNCLFCLQGHQPNEKHRTFKEIKYEIDCAAKSKVKKIILSGGEPTIHPEYLKIVKYCSENKIKQIQTISNGRMFSNENFTKKAINAGLTEITLSIHGVNEKTHDYLVNVPGAFKQILKTIQNLKKYKIIISTDVGIFKQNYKQLPEIINLIYFKLDLKGDIDLIGATHQGSTFFNDVLPNYEKVETYLKKALDICKKNNIVCWVLRVPLKYLKGYEIFKQDTEKLIEEALSISKKLTYFPAICKGKECEYCRFENVCPKLEKIHSKINNNLEEIEIYFDNNKNKIEELNKIKFKFNILIHNLKNINEIKDFKNNNLKKIEINDYSKKQMKIENLKYNYNFVSFSKEISKIFNKNFLTDLKNIKYKDKITIIITNKNQKFLYEITKKFIEIGFKEFRFTNFNPHNFVKREISWITGFKIIDKFNLIPKYENYKNELLKSINLLEKRNINYMIREIPPCILDYKIKQIETDSFLNQIPFSSINKNDFDFYSYIKHIYNKNYKEEIKKCQNCTYNQKCAGFFDFYLKIKND